MAEPQPEPRPGPQPGPSSEAPASVPAWAQLARTHATRRRARRQDARERIHGWVVHPIEAPHLMSDPLTHRVAPLSRAWTVARLVVAALLLHGLMLLVFLAANALIGEPHVYRPPERVRLRIVEPEPELEPEPKPEREAVEAPKPEFESEPEPEPEPTEPKPKPKPKPEPEPEPQVAPTQPEPQPEPATQEPPIQRRRVVGLSLESTVVGGTGPGFAVGTTRLGKTERKAVDAQKASTATGTGGKDAPVGDDGGSGSANRVATRLPVGDAPIVPPKRLSSPEPDYPPLLREQGIEGDVVVVVTIDVQGRVVDVKIARAASRQEFNDAAVASAKRARFTPATRGGVPFTFTQRYTVRFRIHD